MPERKDVPPEAWEPVFVYWPRRAINGPWLVLTEAERRKLPDGKCEYRAVPDDVYDWEGHAKARSGEDGSGEDSATS